MFALCVYVAERFVTTNEVRIGVVWVKSDTPCTIAIESSVVFRTLVKIVGFTCARRTKINEISRPVLTCAIRRCCALFVFEISNVENKSPEEFRVNGIHRSVTTWIYCFCHSIHQRGGQRFTCDLLRNISRRGRCLSGTPNCKRFRLFVFVNAND